jgi:outer membrane receptor protein involved in Fe transport
MNRIFFILALSLLMSPVFSQMPGGQRGGQQISGRFYGKIVDASNKGIDAASVTLVQERIDSATRQKKEVIIGGMLTKGTGDFSIESVPVFGRYKLRVTGIGYKTVESTVNFEMPSRDAIGNDPAAMMGALDKDLGNIKLEIDEKMLGTVTVTASRPMFQMGIDRKVFNVDQNLVSAGGTAVDIMKNVPSVSVDIDGNVSLRNNAPQIFVDGRPTNMTLEQIPADAIESVEIITNPSAKFDASGGTAGILNIVLKKNKRVGYSGNVRASVDSRGKLGLGVNGNVRQNKINVFASANVNQRKSIGTGETDRWNLGDTSVHTLQNDKSTMNGAFGFGRAGFDYFIDNRNTLTLTGSFSRFDMKPFVESDIYSDYFNNTNTRYYSEYQNRTSNSKNENRSNGAQISFKHIFPKAGHEWSADINYNSGKNRNTNQIQTHAFEQFPQSTFKNTSRQLQDGSGNNKNIVFQTDYALPLKDRSKIELGFRASIREMNSATIYYFIAPDGKMITTPERNMVYNSNDNVFAAYGTFSNRIKNFGYQLGLRAESSTYEGVLPNKSQSFNIDFPISFFPSIFLSQKTSESDEFQFNYSRRINRPNFWQLFPFYDISDSLNISRGEPNLQPEFTNSFELSFSKQFKNRDNLLVSAYFKNTNDLITRIQPKEFVPILDTVLPVLTYTNANRSFVTGLEIVSRNKITKWWEVTPSANLFTSKIDLKDVEDPDQFLSYNIRFNNNFKLPKNFTFQLSFDYDSKRQVVSGGGSGGGGGRGGGFGGFGGSNSPAQGYVKPRFEADAALRFDFLKDRAASLSLSMSDLFRTRKFGSHTESEDFIQDVVRLRDPQMLRLNFNWRFGKMDVSLFKRKNTRMEESGMDNVNF